jgi:Glycosyl transferases group 1
VAGTSTALQGGLVAIGVDAEVAFWSPLPGAFTSPHTLGRIARTMYGLRAPLRRDVLHYQYGRTWIPGFLDAQWARLWRRMRVATYHGDDCRTFSTAERLGWPLAPFTDPDRDSEVRRNVQRLARLCDAAIVMDLEMASYVAPFFRRIYVAPIPLHEELPQPRRGARIDEQVVVLHAPSDERVKGTVAVRAAAEAVAARASIELVVLKDVPHRRVADALSEADIVVDQMHSVSASILALEAMRAGLPVLTHLDRRGLAPFHNGLPIVPVTSETLPTELERLVRDEELRRRLGRAGAAYVARLHAAPQAARAVLHVYDHVRSGPPGVFCATAEGVEPLRAPVLDE